MLTNPAAVAIARCATTMSLAGAATPDQMSAALGLDPAQATRLENEVVLPPPPGLKRLRLVVESDEDIVRLALLRPDGRLPLTDLTPLLGSGRAVGRGLHRAAMRIAFADVHPAGAQLACAVLADLAPTSAEDTVESVTLYLHRAPEPD